MDVIFFDFLMIEYWILLKFQMDYINSSHPNFIGGNKAVEVVMQQLRSSQVTITTLMGRYTVLKI